MTLINEVLSEVLNRLVQAVGEARVLQAAADMTPYLSDWHGDETGTAIAVVRPGSTSEVQSVLAICHEARVAVIPKAEIQDWYWEPCRQSRRPR
ncbi:hypothetical protein L1889_17900 [Paenalcaligenes niemegkensis]|uniref:hypothetical protein n=1 Tax=Paenalcaligenes niemegkensis TaxID=2895469 RepID=UPI001EE9038D|nr:hypothetical protein [Paenalcaligenes niemegkensis]MCQ9618324.1 hypothetical protein [Paenalcaligenes niemegkensis]